METLTRQQARRLDELALSEHGMSTLSLLENAGRESAQLLDQLHRAQDPPSVVIVCGKGHNGGDGLVMARYLLQLQYRVAVVVASETTLLAAESAVNLSLLREGEQTGITLHQPQINQQNLAMLHEQLSGACWYVDALLGTGSRGDPRAPLDQLIRWFNSMSARRIALDIPSGLDCDSGEVGTPCIEADLTFTFVAPKPGLLPPANKSLVGNIHVIDIGVPQHLVSTVRGLVD